LLDSGLIWKIQLALLVEAESLSSIQNGARLCLDFMKFA
jgi:hypothetical protein